MENKVSKYQAQTKFNKENSKCLNVRFMIKRDKDLLEYISMIENKTDYIRNLILQDMEENKKEGN